MPHTSSFFSNTTGYSPEQELVDDLTREQIKIYGLDIFYMPRKHLNMDKLLHEGSKSTFEIALPMPVYVKSFSGYQNGMELLTKFGVRNSDEVNLVMSRSEFITSYAPYIKSYYESIEDTSQYSDPLDKNIGHTAARPKEGDLVYFPFDDGIFEIKYVMFDQPFFQLGKGYVFELQCEKFEYSGESFSTGYSEIDDLEEKPDYYRLEMSLDRGGYLSFDKQEDVAIYQYSEVGELPLFNEDGTPNMAEINRLRKDHQLYKDPGFIERIPFVTATVMEWNARNQKLILGDVSDIDPDRLNRDTGNIEDNKFDDVIIIGQTSGAVYISNDAKTRDTAFNDDITIQEEFNEIKILDIGDENPFGFF